MAAIFDLGVVLILLISAGVSFFRGFIREVLTIVGVIGGALAALMFGKSLTPITRGWFGIVEGEDPGKLFNMIPKEIAADIAAYVAIFLTVFIILQLASHFFSAMIAAVGLGPVDRTLGVVFGLARGILFLGLLFLPVLALGILDNPVSTGDGKETTYRESYFSNSKTLFYVEGTSKWIRDFMPDSAEEAKETTSDRLKAMGVLDNGKADPNKPLTPMPGEDGYGDKDRSNLEGLIEKTAPAEKKYND